jgi:hypothetical protein
MSYMRLYYTRPAIAFAANKLPPSNSQPGELGIYEIPLVSPDVYSIRDHSQLGLAYYSNDKTSPVYKLLQEYNIIPPRPIFAFSD